LYIKIALEVLVEVAEISRTTSGIFEINKKFNELAHELARQPLAEAEILDVSTIWRAVTSDHRPADFNNCEKAKARKGRATHNDKTADQGNL
jgi:hypothetical protein